MRNRTRALAAGLLMAVALGGGVAQAGTSGSNSVDGSLFQPCGNWILKLRNFGKIKVNDYNAWVPPNFQSSPDRITPQTTFVFGPTDFTMFMNYPDQMGVPVPLVAVSGTYTQKGKKLKFRPDDTGIARLGRVFADFSENSLFGDPDRRLVVDIPFQQIRNADNMRFKGILKNDGQDLKVKFKANMLYDIQYINDSEFADIFNAKGRLKLRANSQRCP